MPYPPPATYDSKEPQEHRHNIIMHDTSILVSNLIVNGCWHHDQPTAVNASVSRETLPEMKLRWLNPISESEDKETD